MAFVPDPLPPTLSLNWEIHKDLSAADHALGELAGVGSMIPHPHLLISPFLRREAVLSSRIEGTTTTVRQLALLEATGAGASEGGDIKEVTNYVRAMAQGLQLVKRLPVSLRLIRELHRTLLEGVRGRDRRPGEFRIHQNQIGLPEPRFIPPPVVEMNEALGAFEQFLAVPPEHLPPLIHLALSHYQFETIHPFGDGNGRVGRLLIALLMNVPNLYRDESLLPQPLLYLSAYFDRHRDDYYDHLLHISQQGAWEGWIRFFLKGVFEQCHDAIQRSRDLLALQRRYREQVQTIGSSSNLVVLADDLIANPFVTSKSVGRLLRVTPMTVYNLINALVKVGVLKETTGKERNRMWVAEEVLEILREES